MNIAALPRTAELLGDARRSLVLRVVDQTALPGQLIFVELSIYDEVIEALRSMVVRGAPAIGYCGACALALWACNESGSHTVSDFLDGLHKIARSVTAARPTAVNLSGEVHRFVDAVEGASKENDLDSIRCFMVSYCDSLASADEAANRILGSFGAKLLSDKSTILTHCNAGSLATVFYGTALGVVYSAAAQGKIERVYIDETRPLGQGVRLTAWELSRVGIPGTLICDSMAASLMANGAVDAVIVGADRVCLNGDFANKIGTYGLAVLADYHNIPLYVAAPLSSFDLSIKNGAEIPIERRSSSEVTNTNLNGIDVINPAFDVTPAKFVTHFITEKGILESGNLDVLHKSN